ncbi:PH domain-containing protein [Paraferrimonas haliotis]|uniref:Membrane protein n=1 Tax=Paraferrimonas haliotis TaxID=2013866 RepID=A0AA37WZS2_9GAMM|nr:PH domain-containing protein [Paraferrimonas haliotis]GLS84096.1 membrane protein [Paraferrimonas haliotis]
MVDDMANKGWQRISLVGVIYYVVRILQVLLSNILYLIPALYISSDKISQRPELLQTIVMVTFALIGLFALLNYYFFQYRLTTQQLEIRSGVFSKKRIDLPFERIQNIEVCEPLYYRPLNYCYLQFDTAGSSAQEAKIVAISLTKATALKAKILAYNEAQRTDESDQETPESGQSEELSAPLEKETTMNLRNIDDLVLHGLSSNRAWIILAGLAPFIDNVGEAVAQFMLRNGINVEQYFAFEGMTWWQIGLTLITVTFTTIFIMSLISVIGSVIVYYNFELSKQGDRYIRRCGLFTVTEVSMRLSRLQVIVRQQDWLDVLFRRSNLRFEQSNANTRVKPGASLTNKILVPSVTIEEAQNLVADAYPTNRLFDIPFQRISPRYLLRNMGLFALPPYLLLIGLFIYHQDTTATLYATAAIVVLVMLMVLRYLRWGYATDDNFIYIRKGCLGVDHYCFARHKMQQLSVRQTPLTKRHQLCSLKLVLASGSYTIPYISEQEAYKLANDSLYRLEKWKASWM